MDGTTGEPGHASATRETLCVECDRVWEDPSERWRAYVASDDPPLIGMYCPECAAREFDCGY